MNYITRSHQWHNIPDRQFAQCYTSIISTGFPPNKKNSKHKAVAFYLEQTNKEAKLETYISIICPFDWTNCVTIIALRK